MSAHLIELVLFIVCMAIWGFSIVPQPSLAPGWAGGLAAWCSVLLLALLTGVI